MKQITFYDYGIEDILNGCKNATIRLVDENYEIGDVIKLCRRNGDFIGYIRILSKQFLSFGEIDENIALLENWKDIDSIKNRLCFTYGNLRNNSPLVRYSFVYSSEAPTINVNRRGQKVILKPSEEITLVSSNTAKLKRLQTAMRLACCLPIKTLQVSSEETDKLEMDIAKHTVEGVALAKARYFASKLGKPVFASDDDLILINKTKPIFISEIRMCRYGRLSDDEVVRKVLGALGDVAKEIPAIIRTGMAISLPDDTFATSVVYRSFYLSKSFSDGLISEGGFPLNNLLRPRESRSKIGLDIENILIQPLASGIKEIMEVQDG